MSFTYMNFAETPRNQLEYHKIFELILKNPREIDTTTFSMIHTYQLWTFIRFYTIEVPFLLDGLKNSWFLSYSSVSILTTDVSRDEVRDVLNRNWLAEEAETAALDGVPKPALDEPMMALILSCFCCFSRALRAASSRSMRSCNSATRFFDSLSYTKQKQHFNYLTNRQAQRFTQNRRAHATCNAIE